MAKLESPSTSDAATVHATTKALRATVYDSQANEFTLAPSGSYVAKVNCKMTGAPTGPVFWALRNGSAVYVAVRRVYVVYAFDGTAAAVNHGISLNVALSSKLTWTFAGAATTVGELRTAGPATQITEVRQNDLGFASPGAADALVGSTVISAGVTGRLSVLDLQFGPITHTNRFVLGWANDFWIAGSYVGTVAQGEIVTGFVLWDEHTTLPLL